MDSQLSPTLWIFDSLDSVESYFLDLLFTGLTVESYFPDISFSELTIESYFPDILFNGHT